MSGPGRSRPRADRSSSTVTTSATAPGPSASPGRWCTPRVRSARSRWATPSRTGRCSTTGSARTRPDRVSAAAQPGRFGHGRGARQDDQPQRPHAAGELGTSSTSSPTRGRATSCGPRPRSRCPASTPASICCSTWAPPPSCRSAGAGLHHPGGVGRIFPYGKSQDHVGEESPFVSLLRLRDVTFTAGGTRDVRGWGSQLLGPKLPQVQMEEQGGRDGTVGRSVHPGRRAGPGHGERGAPLPDARSGRQVGRLTPFLDGGQIWTPDERFALDAGELDQDKFFFGTGVGFGYETVVGAVQVARGLQAEPLAARPPGPERRPRPPSRPARPSTTSPPASWRRLQLHFSIGATF